MTAVTIVRYDTTPESAEENQRLVQAVFAELAEKTPAGLRYVAFRLDDGATFIHLLVSEDGGAALTDFATFKSFQHNIRDRQLPGTRTSNHATIVGSYGFLAP
jgi:hypothetical protein